MKVIKIITYCSIACICVLFGYLIVTSRNATYKNLETSSNQQEAESTEYVVEAGVQEESQPPEEASKNDVYILTEEELDKINTQKREHVADDVQDIVSQNISTEPSKPAESKENAAPAEPKTAEPKLADKKQQKSGVALVSVKVLDPNDNIVKIVNSSVFNGFNVQVGAYNSYQEALDVSKQTQTGVANNLKVFVGQKQENGKNLYTVQIGPFREKREADSFCADLKKAGKSCFTVSF